MNSQSTPTDDDGARSNLESSTGGRSIDISQFVADLLMTLEEWRQAIATDKLAVFFEASPEFLNKSLSILSHIERAAQDDCVDTTNANSVNADLVRHCQQKMIAILALVWQAGAKLTTTNDKQNSEAARNIDESSQAFMARLAEMRIICMHRYNSWFGQNDATVDSIVQEYVQYQRSILRFYCKPHIADLVNYRRDREQRKKSDQASITGQHIDEQTFNESNDENDNERPEYIHANSMAAILGFAAALWHPLDEWRAHLPVVKDDHNDDAASIPRTLHQLCEQSCHVIDDQAQQLSETVSNWLWQDTRDSVTEFMHEEPRNVSTEYWSLHKLSRLDTLVEQVALVCQVVTQYGNLIGPESRRTVDNEQGEKKSQGLFLDVLPTWTTQYAALETCLTQQQWRSALNRAVPVAIVVDTFIMVPSVVEDAHYFCTRALERASSTRSTLSLGSVAHLIAQTVWNVDDDGSVGSVDDDMHCTVFRALIEKRGCWTRDITANVTALSATAPVSAKSPPHSGNFASALLDALDDDLLTQHQRQNHKRGRSSNPASGNFLSTLSRADPALEQMQRDTQFCLMNGAFAATGACRSLVDVLDAYESDENGGDADQQDAKQTATVHSQQNGQAVAMVQLTREELQRYTISYTKLLTTTIHDAVELWCGPSEIKKRTRLCLDEIRQFLINENYALDSQNMHEAEKVERLDEDLLGPFQRSEFVRDLINKCEPNVMGQVISVIAEQVVAITLDTMWYTNETGKRFTDWGSLLLAKQMRMLQDYIVNTMTRGKAAGTLLTSEQTSKIYSTLDKLSQFTTMLQIEKPVDWLAYHDTCVFTADEVDRTLKLRVDFSTDAIAALTARLKNREK